MQRKRGDKWPRSTEKQRRSARRRETKSEFTRGSLLSLHTLLPSGRGALRSGRGVARRPPVSRLHGRFGRLAIHPHTRGYLLVLATATLWGLSGSLSKYLMQGGVSPMALAQGRSVVTAALLLLYLAFARPPVCGYLAGPGCGSSCSASFLATVQFTYFSAIERLAVAAAILLEYLSPAMVVTFGWLFLAPSSHAHDGRRPGRRAGGLRLVVRAYDPAVLSLSAVGIAFGVGAAVSFSGYILVGEHLKNHTDVSAQLLYGFAIAAVVLALIRPPWTLPAAVFEPRNLALIAAVGVFGTLLPFGFFLASFRYIDAGRATIVSTLEPVVAGVVAWIWLGEAFSAPQMLGAALVIGAVIALQRDRPDDEAVAAPDTLVFVSRTSETSLATRARDATGAVARRMVLASSQRS